MESENSSSTAIATGATLDALEWERFLGLAAQEALSEPGRMLVLNWADPASWATNVPEAQHLQQETQECLGLLEREALWGPLQGLQDPEPLLLRLSQSAVLTVEDLALLRRWLYAVDSWAETPKDEVRGDWIKKALLAMPSAHEPLRVLEKILTPTGELSENASPRLASLHSEIRSAKKEIAQVLDHLIKTFSQKGVLQENFSDVRDGRYVIPVKISSQGEVDGIIYEASASRQTVFVEPKEVSTLNNRLRRLQNDLTQEIYAVLSEASKRLAPLEGELSSAVQILSHWDAAQARARFSRHYAGKPIRVIEARDVFLKSTAHPLLWWSMPKEQVVRNDLDFSEPARTLLLTGPNTGGKTVLLKTLGLAAICARTGFAFPAVDVPKVPFYDQFFADLGDAQSIETHVSSFSGHILRFKEILGAVTDRSLVLLDELNTATDPEEGAALGRAVLETVMQRGATIVATTHDPHLKALSLSDERILSAGMAFDENARTPTFQLVFGVPGRSRALETAERFGLPRAVLELARGYLTREHGLFEQTLSRLEQLLQEAAHARKEAVAGREEVERLRKEWKERTGATVGEMLSRARQRLRRIVEQAQDEVRASVRRLEEAKSRTELSQARGKISETFTGAAEEIEATLKHEAPELAESLNLADGAAGLGAGTPQTPLQEQLQVGMTVRVPKWKSTGVIQSIESGRAKVSMGSIQMSLTLSDLELLPDSLAGAGAGAGTQAGASGSTRTGAGAPGSARTGAGAAKRPRAARVVDANRPAAPPSQIDLRGKRFEEAMIEVEHYIDQAYRSGAYKEIVIVHGLGTGALREGTRNILKNLPYVKEVRDGGPGRGGTGATVVEFEV